MKYTLNILGIGLIPLLMIMGCQKKEPEKKEVIRPVRAIQIGTARELTSRSFPGKARARNEVNLGFEAGGTIAERPVNKGDSVKKEQLLARLDPRDFENALNAATAERDRALAHRDRIAQAAKTGAVAKQELTNADARLKVAQSQVKIQQKALDDATIIAPFDGFVAQTYLENFQRVQPKQPVLRLLDQSRIKFDVNIPEDLISKVDDVEEVFVRFDAFPDIEIAAVIGEVGTEASATTRTYPVTLYLDQPEGVVIMPGMAGKAYGKGEVERENNAGRYELPVTSVFEKEGKSYVWIIDEKTMAARSLEVTAGELTNFGMMVSGDLKEGQWIATAGANSLKEGQKVRLLSGNAGQEEGGDNNTDEGGES